MNGKLLCFGYWLLFVSAGTGRLGAADVSVSQPLAPNDKEALRGLSEVKIIFDVTTGDPRTLVNRLALIEATRDSIVRQDATARIVVAFRREASLLTQKNFSRVKPDDRDAMRKAQAIMRAMSQSGHYCLEQCSNANREFKIKDADTIPEVKVVGNTYISLGAYENKGYAYIPIN